MAYSSLIIIQAKDEEKNESVDHRVKVIVSRRNPETGEPIEEDSKVKASKEDKNMFAFILRKNVYDTKVRAYQGENNSEIEIINPGLWSLLRHHLGHYPYHILRDTAPGTLYSPYEHIVFYFDELKDAAAMTSTSEEDKLARDDLSKLLKVISDGASGDVKLDKYFKLRPNYKKAMDNSTESETVQFIDLWTVFPPGMLVYGKPFQGQEQVFLVRDNRFTWPEKDYFRRGGAEYIPWKLDAWSYDWKDGSFRRTDLTLLFEYFDGHLPLTSLPFAPLDVHPDRDSIMDRLIRRGKEFRRICESKEDERLFHYDGKAVAEQKGFSGMKNDDEVGGLKMRKHEHNPVVLLTTTNQFVGKSRRRSSDQYLV